MAQMNISKQEKERLLEPNYYDAMIVAVDYVKNIFYDPANPDPQKRGSEMQYRIKFQLTDDVGESFVSTYVSPVLSPKSNLTKICEAVIEGFTTEHELDDADLIGKKLRINVTNKKNEKSGEMKNKVIDFLPLKKK